MTSLLLSSMPFLLPFWVLAWLFAPPAAHAAVATPTALSPQTPARPSLADCSAELNQTLQPTPAGAPADDAQAVWLNGSRWRWPGADAQAAVRLLRSARGQILALPGQAASGHDRALTLLPRQDLLPAAAQARFDWVGPGPEFAASAATRRELLAAHREQLVLVQEDAQGRVLRATTVQNAGALDALFAAATQVPDLGAWVAPASAPPRTHFKLWAPTAQNVALCLHSPRAAPNSSAAAAQPPAVQLLPLRRQTSTGVWLATQAADLSGHTYTYLVDVFVRGVGVVRNRVTDPYSLSLNTDSQRTWVGRLDAPALMPAGWRQTPRPNRVRAATDMAIYELHVRDFSVADATVRPAWRGKYLAFTETASDGMNHLQALSRAGITDLHLLPVFDLATVPERACLTPERAALQALSDTEPGGENQQSLVMASAAQDCFNWGYDPWHFTAPEGSFATEAEDGATRILEFRARVQALHRAGLRVGMDVVYNHTAASGQHPQSVLDRIVPGYYQRLNARGEVERSTCCDNTATENRMMAKLMIDSAVVWARDHHIDSFRFDLMGHQPRAVMAQLQRTVNAAAGRHIDLIGEGWNFGEVQSGRRFVQASQTLRPGKRAAKPCCALPTWCGWGWPALCAATGCAPTATRL